jgi:hypothetical protein
MGDAQLQSAIYWPRIKSTAIIGSWSGRCGTITEHGYLELSLLQMRPQVLLQDAVNSSDSTASNVRTRKERKTRMDVGLSQSLFQHFHGSTEETRESSVRIVS